MAAITADGLTKSYRGVEVLRALDVVVEDGSVAALLGPNGAGKTTLVEILEGHRGRDSGSLSVLGYDPGHVVDFRQLRTVIGVVMQQTLLEPALTPRDLLLRQASYYSDPVPLASSVTRFGLDEFARKPVRSLSGGVRRRLDLALAFVGRPRILFLDEPSTGLDPISRHSIRELIAESNRAGVTVVLTSHDLDEVQQLADVVHILRDGHFAASGSPRDIVKQSAAPGRVEFDLPAGERELLPAGAVRVGERLRYSTPSHGELLDQLRSWEASTGHILGDLTIAAPTLDDAYVTLVGESEVSA